MNELEALELIDQVCAQVQLPREGHERLLAAIEIIKTKITQVQEEKK